VKNAQLSGKRTVATQCKVGACEPFCGIEVDVDAGRLVAVRPDDQHPLSEGYLCIKGAHLLGYQNSPDRVTHPLARKSGRLQQVSWASAIEEIGGRLRAIADRHGPRAVATYWGNAADSQAITMANTFCHAFGSPNSFNVLSLEYTDRGAVAERLYGNENLILQPDVTRAKYALLLGTNPLVTQGLTLLQRRPHVGADLKEAMREGGKVVVVDPRKTQTARMASEHLPIRPGTDFYFMLALIHVILAEKLYDRAFVEARTQGLEAWLEIAKRMPPDRAASITGIAERTIVRVAREFAAADGAYVSTRVGVQTGKNSTLTEWAVATLVALTGNIDRPGGLFYNPGVIDTPALIARFTRRKNTSPSRIGGYHPIFGGLPSSILADEILTEGEGQIRALIVVAGNPVISFPDTAKMERALEKLELLVVVDVFVNDTAAFAGYVLPAATSFERESWHFLSDAFNPRPYAELRQKIVEPPGECRSEWEIFKALSRSAGVPFLNNPAFDRLARVLDSVGIGFSPALLHRYLLFGKTPSYGALKRNPRGVDGHPLVLGRFFDGAIKTADCRIQLAPPAFVQGVEAALRASAETDAGYPFVLISGARRSASYNSWTHNIPALAEKLRGNWAMMNPEDAARLGITDGQTVRIRSASGAIEITMRHAPEVGLGVIAVHQHWGHTYESGMTTARKYPGVNVNHLHSDGVRDPFTGMPVFNGTPVAVDPL